MPNPWRDFNGIIPDKLGQPISVGDYIAYGHTCGSSGMLRIGRVLRVEGRDVLQHQHQPYPYEPRITVQAINDDYPTIWGVNPLARPSVLQYPRRMVVITRAQVPAEYRALVGDIDN